MSTVIMHRRVVVISDIHVGDPGANNLDEFRGDDAFENLLLEVIPSKVGWPATLIVNGDFIDFPQILPELSLHTLGPRFGLAEVQSLARLESALSGHPKVFSALAVYLKNGGQVIVMPGNHDIDLHWDEVFKRLRMALGNVAPPQLLFIKKGYIAEQGIYIEHGNQYAFDNKFLHWRRPILKAPDGLRLERPWGTFFMDFVYNDIEEKFPLLYKINKNAKSMDGYYFIDKIYPHYHAAIIYLRSVAGDPVHATQLIIRLVSFFAKHGKRFLFERMLGHGSHEDEIRTSDVAELVDLLIPQFTIEQRRSATKQIIRKLRVSTNPKHSRQRKHTGLLGHNDKEGMHEKAVKIIGAGEASLIAFGHTHDAHDGNQKPILGPNHPERIFNTGSWVPRLAVDDPFSINSFSDLKLVPLENEIYYLAIQLGGVPTGQLEHLATIQPPIVATSVGNAD